MAAFCPRRPAAGSRPPPSSLLSAIAYTCDAYTGAVLEEEEGGGVACRLPAHAAACFAFRNASPSPLAVRHAVNPPAQRRLSARCHSGPPTTRTLETSLGLITIACTLLPDCVQKLPVLAGPGPPKSAAFGAPLRSTNHHSPLHPSRDYARTGSRRACCSRNVRLSDTHPSSSQCYLQHNTGAVVGPPARPTPTSRACRGQRCNFPSHGKPASSRPAGDHSASSDVRSCCRKCTSAGYLHLALLSILRY